MRDGEVVQAGPIEAVWAAPVDAQTAIFLGYARVISGQPAARVLAASQSATPDDETPSPGQPEARVALRRSALQIDPAGALSARVATVRSTPTQNRLTVVAEGIGEVDAVAPLDSAIGPGQQVALRVDHTRLAVVTDHASDGVGDQ
jgi:thiamine transport system ATP-binding protein